MSHTMKVETEEKFGKERESVLRDACKRMGLVLLPWGKHKLHSSTKTGFAVKLPGWTYPVVLNDQGIFQDNYNGHWGEMAKLDRLRRHISAVEIIRGARRKGYSVSEIETDGEIKLTVTGGL